MNKEKMYDTAMIALGCFIGLIVMAIVAMTFSARKTNQQLEEMQSGAFFNKCAAACAPNDVYSIKYNRCTCNAAVTVKEIK